MSTDREQRLINIMFEVGMMTKDYPDHFKNMTLEQYADWISRQLRENGFDTVPMGASWGVLKK